MKKANSNNTVQISKSIDTLIIDSDYKFSLDQPVLSLVIPVYKVDKFLDRCLQSVLCQTYKNIEIICVNDASTGNEDAIIRKYCTLDKRIKYVKHKNNQGLFQARITGMKYATGEYFAFLDSDDHISIDYYRILMNKIFQENADIVIGDFVDEYEDGKIEYYNYDNIRFRDINLKGEIVYDTFMKQHGLWFGWHTVWNKVYKKKVWDLSLHYIQDFSKQQGHLIMTEDIAFSCTFWKFADSVVNAHNVVYYYYHHSGQSVSNNSLEKFKKNAKDVKAVFDYFKNLLISEKIFEKYETEYKEFLDLYIQFWTGNSNALCDAERIEGHKYIEELFGMTKKENYKDHFHYSMRTSAATFEWYEQIKKNICSKNTEIVSFDLFDTLLLRPFMKPSDLFCLIDDKFNQMVNGMSYVDFQKIRINAEADLRRKLSMGIEEVTLDSIYEEIGKIVNLTKEQICELKNYEIELEIKFIQSRKCGKELYELAKHMNKRIIFVSDIYLPKWAITKMMNKCGYLPDKLYLSSEYLLTKCTGRLFDNVILNEKISPEKIVHIGDNWDSDIVQAQKKKITAHHLASPVCQFKGDNQGIYTGLSINKIFGTSGKQYMGENAIEFLGIRCMLATIANKIFDNPYIAPFNVDTDFNSNPYFIGYYALGMHLYAVTNWIASIAESENRDTIHFVSRDGYLPFKAYNILAKYRKFNSKSNYLYISRKATALLQGSSLSDIQSYINSFSSYNINIKTPIDTFEIIAEDNLKSNIPELTKCGIPYMGKLAGFEEAMCFGKLLFNKYISNEKSGKFNVLANEYFSNVIKENDILFDLGYRGNKEYILTSLIGRPVDSLYIYLNESKALQRSFNRFSLRTFYDYTPSAFAAAREYMFSECAPSCVGYDYENSFKPIFDEKFSEHYFNSFVVNTMQEAALDFVNDFEETFNGTCVAYSYRYFDASLPFEFFMNYSSCTDRNVFGCVTFEDDTFAGDASKMLDDWETALNYHKLNRHDIEKCTIQTQVRVVDKQMEDITRTINESQIVPHAPIENLYYDGLFVKAFSWLNKKYPIGSKKRERLKKLVGKFIK